MLNKVLLVGRLTHDPDMRYLPSGKGVVNFKLACNRPFKNKSGEQEADFPPIVSFRNPENIAQYTSKGSLVAVDGRLQTRSFENQEGKRVFVTEVVADSVQFLESKNSKQDNQQQQNTQQQPNLESEGTPSDDDLPF